MTVINQARSVGPGWSSGSSASGLHIGRNFDMRAPGGRAAAAEARLAISRAAASSIGVAGFARMIPYVGAGIIGYEILDALRYRPDGNGGLERDPGATSTGSGTTQAVHAVNISTNFTGSSYNHDPYTTAEALCADVEAYYRAVGGPAYNAPGLTYFFNATSNVCQVTDGTSTGSLVSVQFGPDTVTSTGCAPGAVLSSLDQRCTTGAYYPTTVEQARTDLGEYGGNMTDQQYQDMVDDAIGRLDLANSVDFGSLPSGSVGDLQVNVAPEWLEVPGDTGTTVMPGGATVHFETTWRWTPQTVSSPTPGTRRGTGRWEGTRTTTTINPDGSTTVEEGPAPSDQPDRDTPEVAPLCEDGSTILACQQLGDLPNDQIPVNTATVEFEAEEVNLPSGCPSFDIVLGPGQSYSVSARACDAATTMRPLVIAAGVFSALMICIAAIRGAS